MKKQLRMRGQRPTAFSSHVLATTDFDIEKQVWLADWKENGLPYCSVYVATTDSEWPCKVGISVNACKRLNGMQTGVWKKLKIARCYWTHTVHAARALEKAVHKRLTEDNVWLHGEWFDMRPKDAAEMIEFVSAIEGIEAYDTIDDGGVILSITRMIGNTTQGRYDIERINRSRHTLDPKKDLANMANHCMDSGMGEETVAMVKEVVARYREHDEDRRLPSLKAAGVKSKLP